MTPSPKPPKGSYQCQDDCTGENFVRKRAVSQIDREQWSTKHDLDCFYVNLVLRDQTALEIQKTIKSKKKNSTCNHYIQKKK